MACVKLAQGADHNRIGGATAAKRNVFAGANTGVLCEDADTEDNTIEGNYFGLNAAGSGIRRLTYGVSVSTGGAQTIGGSAAGARNYFIPTTSAVAAYGVLIQDSGAGTVVQGNSFGVRPAGGDIAPRYGYAIGTNAAGLVAGNTISSLYGGVSPYGAGATPRILRNTFRKCTRAVEVGGGAKPVLGNLGNASSGDDGGNVFAKSNTWHIYNDTANLLKAEGNSFGTTVKAQIDAKIYDKLDSGSLGRVDFDPLKGGVAPTDAGSMLALAGATAVPTNSGAEIAFTLSAPAAVTVDVLNLAGRPIAAPVHQDARPAGTNRVVWSGLAANGLAAPPGRCLIRLRAQDGEGRQATALCSVFLR